MSKLQEALTANKFVVTSEVGPPKGVAVERYLEEAAALKERVTAFNVTDLQSAVMRFGSMATCRLLLDRGMEPVLQMTCRDRNRLALQSDLLSAYGLGVENVLCLTGDHQKLGDHPQAKGEPQEAHLFKMEKKIDAGAQFFQTQAVYDTEKFKAFMKKGSHLKAPILAGIVILKSVGMARFMNANVAGINVPEELIEELKKDKEKTKSGRTGVEIAARIIKEIKDYCQGIHLMPLGWDDKVPAILDGAGL
ncbi:MAG: methylenetetrahydrofolate reductase [Phycisphaerae bacterium SM23_30]|nr:MAG: methylenetetrahydrofolate reductase [Phycisphaerae bacterium SM23_30]